MSRTWYVLHVKPRTEKAVNDHLAILRVFHYLPLVRKETKVQRRKVVRFLPVFPGYVFTRLSPDERMAILRTQHIVRTIEVTDPRRMIHQLRQIEHAKRLPVDLRVVEAFKPGEVIPHCFHYNGYGPDYRVFVTPRMKKGEKPKTSPHILKLGTEELELCRHRSPAV